MRPLLDPSLKKHAARCAERLRSVAAGTKVASELTDQEAAAYALDRLPVLTGDMEIVSESPVDAVDLPSDVQKVADATSRFLAAGGDGPAPKPGLLSNFGATGRMQAAYGGSAPSGAPAIEPMRTPAAAVHAPGSGIPGAWDASQGPIVTPKMPTQVAAEHLQQAAPERTGMRGALDRLTGARQKALEGAQDSLAGAASKMHPDELAAHSKTLNTALDAEVAAVQKARRVAGGVAGGLAAGAAAGGGLAAGLRARAQQAARTKMLGGAGAGLALGAGALGLSHLLSQPKPQPAQAAQ